MIKIIVPFVTAYLLKRLRVFKPEDARVLINYVIYFAIPSIAFKSAYSLGISSNVFKIVFLCWLVTFSLMGLGYLIGRAIGLKGGDLRLWVLMSSFGNTAFLGYPFTYNFFGNHGLSFAVIYDSLGSFVLVLTIGIFIAVGKTSLKALLSFPPSWALILGFLFRPWTLPTMLKEVLNFLAPSVFPVIIFAIGLAVDLSKIIHNIKKSLLVEGFKIFVGGALALIYGLALGISTLPLRVAILEASMPTMIFTIVLALKYKLDHHLATSCASLGILLSFFTAPFWVWFSKIIIHLLTH
ncbi:MAG: AEC family transporter [Thermodesulfobacteria bacterium]|nr:AEC family transporter [Thermodesulfobacteriota bacterium]